MTWEEAAISLIKWAFGAIGGGLIFKTAMEKFGERKRRKRMRRQLYEGILLNYESFLVRIRVATSTEGIKQGTPFRFRQKLNLYLAAWENYSSEANKGFLYTLDEAATIQDIFENFEAINFVSDENPYELLRTAREAVASVDEAILQGKLDKDLLKEVAAPSVWNFISELIEGKRKSYKVALNPF